MTNIDFPYRHDGRGRTAEADEDEHVRNLVEQVLFTAPGERVNRPDFGSGLLDLVFEPGGQALAVSTRAGVEGALQRWLGDVVRVEAVETRAVDAAIEVAVTYVGVRTMERRTQRFRSGGAP